jgi:enamine deaminase RidA (YjgF/YER057c/UK114 family)
MPHLALPLHREVVYPGSTGSRGDMEESMGIEARLTELGLDPGPAPAAAGNYLPAVLVGNLLFTAGQIPRRDGELVLCGVVGEDLSVEEGYEAARLCCLGGLAAARAVLGSLDRIQRVVKVQGYVRSAPRFHQQPAVLNGASDLLIELMGEAGRHARTALGTSELPLGVSVEVDFIFEVA